MELIDKSKKVMIYNDAILRKYHNKKVAVIDLKDNSYILQFTNLDKDLANVPCSGHYVKKGIIRIDEMRLSRESLEALIINAIELR